MEGAENERTKGLEIELELERRISQGLRRRLEEVEKTLEDVGRRNKVLEEDQIRNKVQLEEGVSWHKMQMDKIERRNRVLEAELDGIRRECREPFIVPALVDVFLKFRDDVGV